jgi:hypothetical protein
VCRKGSYGNKVLSMETYIQHRALLHPAVGQHRVPATDALLFNKVCAKKYIDDDITTRPTRKDVPVHSQAGGGD